MSTPEPAGPFTILLWNDISGIRKGILDSGFVRKLAEGTLDEKLFADYIAQDILYLRQDNEALTILAVKAPQKKYGDFFIRLAEEGIATEKAMHDEYIPLYNITEPESQSPVFRKYGKFLLDNALHADFEVAAAALLPCFWMYSYTGNEIYSKSIPGNRYEKFINTYASADFNDQVGEYVRIIEELSASASLIKKDLMKRAFSEGAEYELKVFSAAG